MTNEQLCIAIQSGSGDRQELLYQLYAQNFGMIETIIRDYKIKSFEEREDLRQEAFFGIVRAADLWKSNRDASFLTYAIYWIRQAIRRYMDNCGGVIRVPSYKRDLMSRYYRIVDSYRNRFRRDPTNEELCAALDLKKDQLKELKKDIQARKIRSMSEKVGGEDEDLTLEDAIAAEGDPIGDMIDRIQDEQLAACLWSEVDSLPDRQRDVIRERYREGHTLAECGAALGISPERVRKLEITALRQLRDPKHAKKIRPYLTDESAYDFGIRNTGISSFRRCGSSQERAVMQLEEQTGMNLWGGKLMTW